MSAAPLRLRPLARADLKEIARHYRVQAGATVMNRWLTAIDAAFAHLTEHPASGSPRLRAAVDMPLLRIWPVQRFPYLVFYLESPTGPDVLRILHASRDIATTLRGNTGPEESTRD